MMNTQERFKSRKFALAVAIQLTSIIALFTGHLGGGEFIGVSATVLGLYGGANVLSERNKSQSN